MSYGDVESAAVTAMSQAAAAARLAQRGEPFDQLKYQESMALAVESLAVAVKELAGQLRRSS